MGRIPFVWDVHLRHEVLEDAVAELRALPYSSLRDLVDTHCDITATGRDHKEYQVKIEVRWSFTGSKTSALRPR